MTIEDMSEYCTGSFLKLADLREPREEVIADCVPGNYGPDLVCESGDVLTLNETSKRRLIRAYGMNCKVWIGKTVKLYAGQVPFKDGMTDAALVEPISPPTSDGKLPPPKPKANGSNNLDDEVPF
jgi:hypothetical protein